MNIDRIPPVAKRHLLLANAIVWGAPGIKILVTGIQSYITIWPSKVIIWLALGISLKFIPGIPTEFFASFYPGLGTALIVAGATFLAGWIKAESRKSYKK